MPINFSKTSTLLASLLVINILIASILNSLVFDELDTYLYDEYNIYLLETKDVLVDTFENSEASSWQTLAISLSETFNSDCLITERVLDNFSAETFEAFALPQYKSGYIDLTSGIIYYVLDEKYVAELGPLNFDTWLMFIAQWFSWISVTIVNLIIAALYLNNQYKKQQKLIAEINQITPKSVTTEQNVLEAVTQIKAVIEKGQFENQARLLLQRDLLHGVAHEFRSPMARMQFALDMLEESPENDRANLMKSLHGSLGDLDELVRELLYYAKLKDIESSLKIEDIELIPLVQSAIEQVAHFYPNIQFTINSSSASVLASATEMFAALDANLTTRMLVNLLRNAGRFASKECHIVIERYPDHIKIVVEDDGVGIPPGKAKRIFEPFTRLDPSRSRDSGGCGLGLAIVSSIVNRHQGSIDVIESRLGGAAFSIILPQKISK